MLKAKKVFLSPTPVTVPICAACIGAYAVLDDAGTVACFNYL